MREDHSDVTAAGGGGRAGGLASGGRAAALEAALVEIASGAEARDAAREPQFPDDAFRALQRCGALEFNACGGERRPPAAAELSLVRRVAAADASVGRIFDGHLNAVERLAVHAPGELRDRELTQVLAGELLAGVWGGDPAGERARRPPSRGTWMTWSQDVLLGCRRPRSGAVLARAEDGGPPLLVWIDVADSSRVEVDASWYQSARAARLGITSRRLPRRPCARAARAPGLALRAAVVRTRCPADRGRLGGYGRHGRLCGARRACRAARPRTGWRSSRPGAC